MWPPKPGAARPALTGQDTANRSRHTAAAAIEDVTTGRKNAECAKKSIESGWPVGLKAKDGKTYLLIGEHKPMNSALAQYAAKEITVKGKVSSRDGVHMIENAEIVK